LVIHGMFLLVDRIVKGAWMSAWSGLRLVRSRDATGGLVVRFGVVLLDVYLEFLAVRSRPNTVVAVGYDLKVFWHRPARRGLGCSGGVDRRHAQAGAVRPAS
jgi:hypothetical protein